MRRYAAAFALSLTAAVTTQAQSTDQSSHPGRGARERPAAQVQEVSDAPLRLSVQTKWATTDQQMLEVSFTATNAATRPVRAYSVRISRGADLQEGGGCFLNDIERAGKVLQPNQSVIKTTWRPVPESDAQTPVDLTLDFVEFADGSVWGVDSCQSAERLGGLREGGRAARLRFKKKLDDRGIDAFLSQLYANDPDLAPPQGRSDAWKAGFRGAISSMRERVRKANEEGGLPEVEAALKRPFDASEN